MRIKLNGKSLREKLDERLKRELKSWIRNGEEIDNDSYFVEDSRLDIDNDHGVYLINHTYNGNGVLNVVEIKYNSNNNTYSCVSNGKVVVNTPEEVDAAKRAMNLMLSRYFIVEPDIY